MTGFAALPALRAGQRNAAMLMVVSLSLTATAGGMALAYWAVRGEFQPAWWLPNTYLLLFPLPLLMRLTRAAPLRGEGTVDGRPRLARARRGKDSQ